MQHFSSSRSARWLHAAVLTTLLVYCYVLLEWLFFITKPSFLSALRVPDRLGVFFSSGLSLTVLCLLALLPVALLQMLHRSDRVGSVLVVVRRAVPAGILAALAFIAIDNFTYSLFRFGVVSTAGSWRLAYALLFAGLLAWAYRLSSREEAAQTGPQLTRRTAIALALMAVSLAYAATWLRSEPDHSSAAGTTAPTRGDLPDIILLGSDGVEASHMQVYGYARATTPTITALASQSLLVENAFPNSGTTPGSLTSILTSKPPTETHLVYAPDILTGADAYEHLPGLLRQLGYTSAQFTVEHYGDAADLNLLDGFDYTNARRTEGPLERWLGGILGGTSGRYFPSLILSRLRERLEHAFFIRSMVNPFESVTDPVTAVSEQERFDRTVSFLDATSGPAFVHLHMMGTHAPLSPPRRVFSAGRATQETYEVDSYDDAILGFDDTVHALLQYLETTGTLEDTLLILYSDHGTYWRTTVPVPLVFRFPGGRYAGRIRNNVQNLDIAPTVLDYLGVPVPEWMTGVSLLRGEPAADRAIFSANVNARTLVQFGDLWTVNYAAIRPPFFQLGNLTLITCNWRYTLLLPDRSLTSRRISDATTCDPADVLTEVQARAILLQHLQDNGYDVSSLR